MTNRGGMVLVAFRGIVVASLFIGLWFWLAATLRRFDPMLGMSPPQSLQLVGWILAVGGGLLGLSCVAMFITRGHGTPAPFDPPQVFVATGPYRYVRNPMYVGAVCTLLGAGLIVRSPSILLLAVAFWGLSHTFVVLNEEPSLERRFGDSYSRYRQQVNRWLPRRPRA